MKLKSFLIILFSVLFFDSYNSQMPDEPMTISQYPTFYDETVQKMNNIILNKTQYYGQPLSVFLRALHQKNIIIKSYDAGPYNNKFLKFAFVWNMDVEHSILDKDYVQPYIYITFQQPFNYQQAVGIMNNDYHSYWNTQAENFYKNLIIEKIEFWYVSGLTNKSAAPK